MKFRRLNTTKTAFLLTVLLGFCVTDVQRLLADEHINLTDFQDCRVIKGKAERLLCYDTIADGGVFNQQQVRQVQEETFGAKDSEPDIAIDKLGVTIERIEKDASGKRYFYTTGGQVWKQQKPGSYPSKVPFEAELKSGTLGSFFLVNESGRSTRVKRIK
jgi:hypothetical protein